jgi:hypothetical protein
MSHRLVRKDIPDIEIVATLEQIPGQAHISGASLGADGRIEVEFAGGTSVDWDGQRTCEDAHGRRFVDETGAVVGEDRVALQAGAKVIVPSWSPTRDPVRDAMEPMLVASTSHLTASTLAGLASSPEATAPHRVIAHDYGFLLYVGQPAECVADLAASLALARAYGAVWLNFDRDAAELPGLPTYAHEGSAP